MNIIERGRAHLQSLVGLEVRSRSSGSCQPQSGAQPVTAQDMQFLVEAISRDKGASHSIGGVPLCAQQPRLGIFHLRLACDYALRLAGRQSTAT